MVEVELGGSCDAMKSLFSFFDSSKKGFISAPQVQILHKELRIGGISMPQVYAAIEQTNLNRNYLYLSDLHELLQEMDRRYFLVQDLKWEFAMLDNNQTGCIPVNKARFLMEARHGSSFSERAWGRLLSLRPVPEAPLTFAEIEVELCNIMYADVALQKAQSESKRNEEQLKREKLIAAKRETQQKLELQEKEAKRLAEENEKILEAQRREREEARLQAEEEEKLMAEDRARKAIDAEAKDQEARQEHEQAAHQEKMLLEAMQREKDAEKKKEVELKLKEARKRAEKANQKRIKTQLKVAVEKEDRKILPKAIQEFKDAKAQDDDNDLEKAERLLRMFKCSDELKDGISQRLIDKLEDGLANARKDDFDRKELRKLAQQAGELLIRLKRLERLRHEVLQLKQATIAEIRSYQNPPSVVHDVMMATYLLLGIPLKETKKWSNLQVLLGKTGREALMRRIRLFNVGDLDQATAKKALNQMGDIDLEMIRDVSAGAATFYVWVDGMVTEVLTDD